MTDDPSGARPGTRERERLQRLGRRLEYATVTWNSLEAVVAVSTGVAARSLALVAFGLDSLVEVFASIVVLWYMRGSARHEVPLRARRAVRLIAVAFVVLGSYLLVTAVAGLVSHAEPGRSTLGTVFMALTVVVMFVLAAGKRRTGQALGNRPLVANATMTFIDGCLAVGVLGALLATRLAGWWWSDPAAGIAVAILAVHEAREARRSEMAGVEG